MDELDEILETVRLGIIRSIPQGDGAEVLDLPCIGQLIPVAVRIGRSRRRSQHDPVGRNPLLLANAWDVGSARLLASLGYEALATTSAGHAGTLGRADGGVSRDEALAHARELAGATELPVSADFENGFRAARKFAG